MTTDVKRMVERVVSEFPGFSLNRIEASGAPGFWRVYIDCEGCESFRFPITTGVAEHTLEEQVRNMLNKHKH